MKNQTPYVLQVHCAVLLFGLAGVLGKSIAVPAVIITLGRVVFSSAVLYMFLKVRNESLHISEPKDRLLFFLAGCIMAVHWTAFLSSVKIANVAIGTITGSTFPLFAAFLEPLFFAEKLRLANVVFAVVMLAGVVILMPLDAVGSLDGNIAAGIALGMTASFTYALLSLMNRRFARRYYGFTISFFEQFVAACVLLPTLFFVEFSWTGTDLVLLIFLGVVCTAGSHSLFINGLKGVTVQAASLISGMEVVYSCMMAFVFLGAVPSEREWIGGAIVFFTVMLSSVYRHKCM